ncbi:hypothetical protein CSAL01_11700 [Colletotrichum salicis]|uniref:Uncharacterized protein n=1 Tax=Colletotrichum salicis TaxID=1209931 RepID=A0A135V0N2_9PEZI|nr:hypothetical protein CSAL01_11700 [Colletotrichum salicis]
MLIILSLPSSRLDVGRSPAFTTNSQWQCWYDLLQAMYRFFSFLLLFAPAVRSEGNIEGVVDKSQVFWQLANLDQRAPEKLGNVYLGGQNYTWCCLKAVEAGLRILENGTLIISNNSITNISALTTGELRTAANRSQFPCDAKYNGVSSAMTFKIKVYFCSSEIQAHIGGAPEVRVQYKWFIDTCPGWSLSDKSNLNAWLHSLSGFLVPAVVFCLSVPRRRKLHVPRHLFTADLGGIKNIIPAILGAIIAGLIVTVDTIIWLSICFAFAGPMILSGLYEAFLDNRVLEFLRTRIYNSRLTLDMRCRCLMLVLIGNLDLALGREGLSPSSTVVYGRGSPQRSDEETGRSGADNAPDDRPPLSGSSDTPSMGTELTRRSSRRSSSVPQVNADDARATRGVTRQSTNELMASPWRHMENVLYDIRLYDDDNHSRQRSPRQWPKQCCQNKTCGRQEHTIQEPLLRFFLGGFIFSFLTSLDELGDENIAESIAFGSWYMIIPHIAIISGLLLAGNNPNILEGVLATERDPENPEDPFKVFGFLPFDLVYPSCYKVAWQWQRGHTKKLWIEQLLAVYSTTSDVNHPGHRGKDGDMKELRSTTTLSLLDWFVVLFLTLLLVGIPYLFAFMLAFFTPQIGLSCRSLTFLVYFGLQLAQVGLWLWAYVGPLSSDEATTITGNSGNTTRPRNIFRKEGWLDSRGFYDPSRGPWHRYTDISPNKNKFKLLREYVKKQRPQGSHKYWFLLWYSLYYSLQFIFGLSAVFVSLGGTLMQIMGVYRTNMCFINAHHWLEPKERRPPVVLSVNSREMIKSATTYWEPVAIAAIAFMAVVSFVGWWYQRRMRDIFGQLVKLIDEKEFERDKRLRPDEATPTSNENVGNGQ